MSFTPYSSQECVIKNPYICCYICAQDGLDSSLTLWSHCVGLSAQLACVDILRLSNSFRLQIQTVDLCCVVMSFSHFCTFMRSYAFLQSVFFHLWCIVSQAPPKRELLHLWLHHHAWWCSKTPPGIHRTNHTDSQISYATCWSKMRRFLKHTVSQC